MFVVCSVLLSGLSSGHIALSTSPNGGLWLPNNQTNGEDAFETSVPFDFRAQSESSKYARVCYNGGRAEDGCDTFIQQALDYSVNDTAACPFETSMCFGGPDSALEMSTGPVSARAIGINTPDPIEFERTTTCSPLNMNATYITAVEEDGVHTYSYNYGQTNGGSGNITWESKSHQDVAELTPGYSVR